jgi:hypothetical protein
VFRNPSNPSLKDLGEKRTAIANEIVSSRSKRGRNQREANTTAWSKCWIALAAMKTVGANPSNENNPNTNEPRNAGAR